MSAIANKPQSESRYESVFADSVPDTDITFMVPFLKRPTNHYLVGVDNLTISLSKLGILDSADEVILQIIRRRRVAGGGGNANDAFSGPSVNFLPTTMSLDGGFSQRKLGVIILTLNEFLIRLDTFASQISHEIESAGLTSTDNVFNYPANTSTEQGHSGRHLGFWITPDGRLAVDASAIFWSSFIIQFPTKKYREILGFTNEFLSLTALAGSSMGDPASTNQGLKLQAFDVVGDTWTMNDFPAGGGDTIADLQGWEAELGTGIGASADLKKQVFDKTHSIIGNNCIFSSLDRRVSIELGTSLPIMNSPLIDHDREMPDFVLGRWMFPRSAQSEIECGSTLHGVDPKVRISQSDHNGVITLQGSRDRVLYHSLRPQEKIQTVRLKLYARVRKYSPETGKWSMDTIAVPTNDTDWWHARLHFVSKD